ncbi:MAG: RloB domain-containing protein [Saprospiraceae bacterium]|jgi:hypothetical protein|nr:RloB domain-containing protein [Saprospiraceae bacterium]
MAKKTKGLKGRHRVEPTIQRPIKYRNYQYLFLIVCEDEQTERIYFGSFASIIPENTLFLRSVGTGLDPKRVVERTIVEREKLKNESRKEVDESWAVFDKDDADENERKIRRFEEAFSIADEEGINLAYTNEAFELWLLLHLTAVPPRPPLPRHEIYQRLEAEISRRPGFEDFRYNHRETEAVDILDKIRRLGDENAAVRRAEALLAAQAGIPPIQANPSTCVHLLVKSLREKIDFYSWQPD